MILPAGLAIRFKGNNSDRYATEFCDSLRGHCSRTGSKLVITKTTHVQVKMRNGETPFSNQVAAVDLNRHRSNGE